MYILVPQATSKEMLNVDHIVCIVLIATSALPIRLHINMNSRGAGFWGAGAGADSSDVSDVKTGPREDCKSMKSLWKA